MKTVISACTLLLLLGIANAALADINSPAGLWKTIDDKTGKERSFVRISDNNGVFEGRVEKIFDQPTTILRICAKRARVSARTSRSSA
jgi:hypothetical protein